MNKYKLRNAAKRKQARKLCINCGRVEMTTLPDIPGFPDPNTTAYIDRSLTGMGTKWGCRLGNHKMYFDYELVKA